MEEMYWAKDMEKQEIIEFMDYVFSKAHRPHDFKTLLPKLYGACGEGIRHHFIVREQGKIVATVLACPIAMHIGGAQLTALGVGSVSTHPQARGKGYMKALMGAVDQRAAETGADFAVLSGERQRYGYFGYDYGGYQMNGLLTAANVRHALADVDVSVYAAEPMHEAHAAHALRLQRTQPCYCARREEAYLDILRSWNNQPFAVMKHGKAVGFGTLRQNPDRCHIAELLLEDECDFPAAIKLLSMRHGKLSMTAAPWQKVRAAWIAHTCQDFSMAPNHSYKIYHPERVREACAALDGRAAAFGFDGFALPLPLYIAPPDAV